MRSSIRKLGNSSGVIIPKSMLAEIGIAAGDAVDLSLEDSPIAITPIKRRPREDRAEAFREIAETGDDALVWPEFGNIGDNESEGAQQVTPKHRTLPRIGDAGAGGCKRSVQESARDNGVRLDFDVIVR